MSEPSSSPARQTRPPAPRKNDLAALGLVNRRPMHGYALRQAIGHMGLEEWANLPTSSIYSALRRLAREGAVSITREREGRAPERTVYHITSVGRELLAGYLREALSQVGPEDRLFYLALAFADGLAAPQILAGIARRIERLEVVLEQMRVHLHEMRRAHSHPHHLVLMSEGGRQHMKVELDICQRLRDLFRSRPDYFRKFGGMPHDK